MTTPWCSVQGAEKANETVASFRRMWLEPVDLTRAEGEGG